MAGDRTPQGLALLWVPIVMALLAAGLLTVRGCQPPGGRATPLGDTSQKRP